MIPFNGRGGWVYLIANPLREGTYKIGETLEPWRRLRDIRHRTGNPELVLVHCIYTNDRKRLESHLHKRFATKLIGGEWFHLRPENVAAVMGAAYVRYSDVEWVPIDAWRPSRREEAQMFALNPYPVCGAPHV